MIIIYKLPPFHSEELVLSIIKGFPCILAEIRNNIFMYLHNKMFISFEPANTLIIYQHVTWYSWFVFHGIKVSAAFKKSLYSHIFYLQSSKKIRFFFNVYLPRT